MTASSTGSGSVAVRIPAGASQGPHDLWLVGGLGTTVQLPLSISAAEVPTPIATPTSAVEPTATVPAETPTVETPTETPDTDGDDTGRNADCSRADRDANSRAGGFGSRLG